jgi:tetratricopeptide (TPR) repeat protein
MPIVKASVAIEAFGKIALTRTTLTFFNTESWQFEADVDFPLPKGARVCGYALDVNGVMVDGVGVELERGRVVFETLERRRIDPGLAELVDGNRFHTRVFPVLGRSSRTVMIQYVHELPSKNEQAILSLPLDFGDKLRELTVQVDVYGPPEALAVQSTLPGLKFSPAANGVHASLSTDKPAAIAPAVVSYALPPEPSTLIQKAPNGLTYFCTQGKKPLPPSQPLAQPKTVLLLWDASGSEANADHKKCIDLLKAYFGKFPDRDVDVYLAVFRHQLTFCESYKGQAGKLEALYSQLSEISYDGATRIDCLGDYITGVRPDLTLLFSDGNVTMGKPLAQNMQRPLFAISAGPGANNQVLEGVSGMTGGKHLPLDKMSVADAAAAMGQSYTRLQAKATPWNAAELISDYQAGSGLYMVTGRLSEPGVTLTLPANLAESAEIKVTVKQEQAQSGRLLERYWAEGKLKEAIAAGADHDELVELGREYGLVTPRSSLIVLESLEQYLQFDILPPASLEGMRQEFLAKRRENDQDRVLGVPDQVMSLWQSRVRDLACYLPFYYAETDSPARLANKQPKESIFKYSKYDNGNGSSGGIFGNNAASETGAGTVFSSGRPQTTDIRDLTTTLNRNIPPSTPPARLDQPATASPSQLTSPESADTLTMILPWHPAAGESISKLSDAGPSQRLQVYYRLRQLHKDTPAFYFACGDFFMQHRQPETALQIYCNILELQVNDALLLQALGRRFAQAQEWDLAVLAFENAHKLNPSSMVLCRDLAGALFHRIDSSPWKRGSHESDCRRIVDLLSGVLASLSWKDEQMQKIVLTDLARIWPKIKSAVPAYAANLDRQLCDIRAELRVVLTWDNDNGLTTAALIVEPDEQAIKQSKETSPYKPGPFETLWSTGIVECMVPARYNHPVVIQVECHGAVEGRLLGPSVLHVEVIRKFGEAGETRTSHMCPMPKDGRITIETVDLAERPAKRERT